MDYLKEMQSYQPEFYEEILEMQEILKADSIKLEQEEKAYQSVINSAFAKHLELWGVERWEKILGIVSVSAVLEERISLIISRLRGFQKLSATRIKEIALSYKNGDVTVEFVNSKIKITYNSVLGIPPNFQDFQNVIEQLKPAHLGLEFAFKYRRHEQLTGYTHQQLSRYTHQTIREGTI